MTLLSSFQCLPKIYRLPCAVILVSVAYFFSAKFGLSLSFKPDYIAALWPPNAILLAALFLAKPKHWIWFLLAIIPAELAADLPSGIRLSVALGFVGADWIEVLTAAAVYRRFSKTPPEFNNIRIVFFYILCCVLIAPFVAAFPGAMVTGIGQITPAYLTRWARWFASDALTHLLITPFIVLWLYWNVSETKSKSFSYFLELLGLMTALFILSLTSFSGTLLEIETFPAIIYAPFPILLWASVRFGPRGIFSSAVFIAIISIWLCSHGYGPFKVNTVAENVINLQVFLLITLTPLLFLAALIEERRKSEEQFRESQKRYRGLIESTSDWVWEVDRKGVYTYSSPKVKELLGYDPEEVVGKTPFDFMLPDEAKRIADLFFDLATSQKPFDAVKNINTHKNGTQVILETSAVPIFDGEGELLGYRGIDREITDREKAEAAILKNEELFRDLYENAPNPYLSVGIDGHIIRCNQRAGELLGYETEALIGRSVLDLYADNTSGKQKAIKVLRRFQRGEAIRDEELQMQKADGTPFWIQLTVNVLKDAQGKVVESRSMIVDISERKMAEQALADSQQRLADIIEFLPDPTLVIDMDGRVTAWNRAMERVSGIGKKEILGKGDYAYALPFYGKPRPILVDQVLKPHPQWEKEYLSLREIDGVLVQSESFHPSMGDGGRYFSGTASRLYNTKGEVVGAIETIRDITNAKCSEQDRDRLIAELQASIAKVQTLSGLLPICAACKKIRDDQGYWNQIESYIRMHSKAEFSHSICPECAKKLYPELYPKS